MPFKPFVIHQPDVTSEWSYDLIQAQDQVGAAVDQVLTKEHLDSVLYEDVSLSPGVENWLEHGLDRAVRGFHIVDIDLPAMVYRVTSSTADLTKYLPLACTDTLTVSIVVF
jgi:hypothetical protein